MFRVFAVLPAAGSGERFGVYPPKQFQKIYDKPVISYTIEAFEKLQWVEKVIVVVAVDEFEIMRNIVRDMKHSDKVVLVPGESTRHGSISNGIKYMSSGHVDMPPDIVIIHDAVRPFLTDSDLNNVAMEAFKNGACGYVRPLVSTVVTRNKEGFLADVYDRRACHGSEMPQAFKFEVIKEAYNKCTKEDVQHGTECLLLVQKHTLGHKIKLLDGAEHLWKITYAKDHYAAVAVVKEKNSRIVYIGDDDNPWRNLLHSVTKSKDSCFCSSVDKIPQPIIQNVTFCHKGFDAQAISISSKQCASYFTSNCMSNCTMIHLVTNVKPDTVYLQFMHLMKTLASQLKPKSVMVYGICTDQEGKCNIIGNSISSIIHDRNQNLSGQVFLF